MTVYTAGPKGLANALAKGFTAKTQIKVNLFQATTGKVMARLAAEQANPQCDVLVSASWATAPALKAKGQLLAYMSPNAKTVPAALKDPDYVAQGAAALAIIWNPKTGKPKPHDWSDLALASYKNAVTMPDPAASGSAYGLVSGLAANSSFGWTFFQQARSKRRVRRRRQRRRAQSRHAGRQGRGVRRRRLHRARRQGQGRVRST